MTGRWKTPENPQLQSPFSELPLELTSMILERVLETSAVRRSGWMTSDEVPLKRTPTRAKQNMCTPLAILATCQALNRLVSTEALRKFWRRHWFILPVSATKTLCKKSKASRLGFLDCAQSAERMNIRCITFDITTTKEAVTMCTRLTQDNILPHLKFLKFVYVNESTQTISQTHNFDVDVFWQKFELRHALASLRPMVAVVLETNFRAPSSVFQIVGAYFKHILEGVRIVNIHGEGQPDAQPFCQASYFPGPVVDYFSCQRWCIGDFSAAKQYMYLTRNL